MSTATMTVSGPSTGAALAASTRGELLRLRKWPALWVMAAVWLMLNLVFSYVFPYITYTTGDSMGGAEESAENTLADMLPDALPQVFTGGMPMFGGAIMLILGALAAGSGYGWGTWKTSLTQGPGRLATFGGMLAAVLAAVVGIVALTFAIDLGVSALVATVESQTIVWPALADMAEALGAGVLICGTWAVVGVLIGLLTRSPALAVGLGLVWTFVVETLLRGVAEALSALEYVTNMLPGTAAGSLAGAMGAGSEADGDSAPGVLTTLSGTASVAILVIYLVGCVIAAAFLVRRRDLT